MSPARGNRADDIPLYKDAERRRVSRLRKAQEHQSMIQSQIQSSKTPIPITSIVYAT
jgi:hypothetical protein